MCSLASILYSAWETIVCVYNLSVFIISVSSKMSETNTEVVSLLKSLSDRFDSLQKDVDPLNLIKEKEARRSASVSSDSEAEPSNGAAPTREQSRSGSKRRESRRSLKSRSPASRSRSRFAAVTVRAKAKLRRLRTAHAAKESDRDPRDVRPAAGPTGCRTMKTPQWTIPRSSLVTQRLRISQMIKWRRLRNSSRRSALGECRIVTECKSEVTTRCLRCQLPELPSWIAL